MDAIRIDPDILAGTPCFAGTRVPVRTLFDFLEAGDPLDEFLRQFPTVRRDQAVSVLETARRKLVGQTMDAPSTASRVWRARRRR